MKPSERITKLILDQKHKGRSDAVACDAAIILYLDELHERIVKLEQEREEPSDG